MNEYVSYKTNWKICSILILIVLNLLYREQFNNLLLFWTVNLLISNNCRRLSINNSIAYIVRVCCYFVPFAIPSIIYPISRDSNYLSTVVGMAIAIVISLFIYFLERRKWKLFLSRERLILISERENFRCMILAMNFIGAAITEELFFREFILSINISNSLLLVILSCGLFWLSHYTLPWAEQFERSDFFKQLLISFISCLLYLNSESIFPSITLHMMMNLPIIAIYIKLLFLSKDREVFDDYDVYEELDI